MVGRNGKGMGIDITILLSSLTTYGLSHYGMAITLDISLSIFSK